MLVPTGITEDWRFQSNWGSFTGWRSLAIRLFDLATVYAREGLTEIARDVDFLAGIALEHGYTLKAQLDLDQNPIKK
jgi:hypothetical protein